jgi:hypothetical protein
MSCHTYDIPGSVDDSLYMNCNVHVAGPFQQMDTDGFIFYTRRDDMKMKDSWVSHS